MSIELPYIPLSTNEKAALVGTSGTPATDNKYVTNADTRIGLTGNTTVNLDASMTAAQIQALIDAQHRDLNGYTLIFQFADGTYTLSAGLIFTNFTGGAITIRGKTSESTASLTKSVKLQFTGSAAITATGCDNITFQNLEVDAINTNKTLIKIYTCRLAWILQSGFSNVDAATLACINIEGSSAFIQTNVLKFGLYGIQNARVSIVCSATNVSDTDKPAYGLRSESGGTVYKRDTQPTGSTADESAVNGGQIV